MEQPCHPDSMTSAVSVVDRKIYWLIGIGLTLNLLANAAPDSIYVVMTNLLAGVFNFGALYLMWKHDWLEIGAFMRRRRR